MRKLLVLAAAVAFVGCTPDPVAQQQCVGQPLKVVPMPSYVMEQCANGQVINLQVPANRGYTSGTDALNDPFFWMFMMGSSYGHSPIYRSYVASPVYRSYHVTHINRTYNVRSSSSYRSSFGGSSYRSSSFSSRSYGGRR